MKKLFLLFLMLCFAIPVMADETNNVINSVEDGKKIVCTGKKIKGLIEEYDDVVVDYYTFKDGRVYSPNMRDDFRNGKTKDKKVKNTKITADDITFKEAIITWDSVISKNTKINRKTGEYSFKAKKQNIWELDIPQMAVVVGTCKYE